MMSIEGLYAIADPAWNPHDSLCVLVREFLSGGARIVQLRMKKPDDADPSWESRVEIEAESIAALKADYDFTFIVNDYVDVATRVGADGVHVGENDMPVDEVKRRVPEGMIVGYSSHSLGEAREAVAKGADYVAFGAIFPTPTKGPGHPVQGIDALKELAASVDVPVVAIGGIVRDNVDRVIEAGADSVAMITGLTRASSIVEETRWFAEKLRNN
jgi:thiamine-phosphate pyrophosphorylase